MESRIDAHADRRVQDSARPVDALRALQRVQRLPRLSQVGCHSLTVAGAIGLREAVNMSEIKAVRPTIAREYRLGRPRGSVITRRG